MPDTRNNGNSRPSTRAKNKNNSKNYAAAAEENLNEYIVSSIYQRMEREGRSHMAPPGELEDSQVD